MNVEARESESGHRVDVWPSPMPSQWSGTVVVQVVGAHGITPVWGIINNGSPITPRSRSTDRAAVIAYAVEAVSRAVAVAL